MITNEQLADEQRKEREFNKLSEAVISKTAWGKFYGLMRGASRLLTDNLKQSVGIDSDGRPIVVYKKDVSKVLGTFAVPAHEWMAKEYAKKDLGGLIGSVLTMGISSMAKNIKQQKKAKFFDISPKEVEEMYAKQQDKKADSSSKGAGETENKLGGEKRVGLKNSDKILGMPKKVAIGVGIGVVVIGIGGFIIYKKIKK